MTHDQEEALAMADLVVLMNDGAVEQVETARDLQHHPKTACVAEFLEAKRNLQGSSRPTSETHASASWKLL